MNPDTAAAMLADWEMSGHADFTAEAFRHWDADGEVQSACAQCHSTDGFLDYLGADGSAAFSVEAAAPLGTTVNCDACHNPAADVLDQVIFPSGYIATDLGAEARCMTCHQGRESTVSLNTHIAGASVVDDDTADTDLSFRNVHYFAAGATLYGGAVKGAYQYTLPGTDGVVGTVDDEPQYGFYDARNPHVKSADSCIECHNPHSLEREIALCATCHTGVANDADLRDIRMAGSVRDYDADGNATEGVYYEITTMSDALYAAIQMYATNVLGNPIVYDSHAYPYFFGDSNGNGTVDPGEAIYPNAYSGWSARLLRAAYNFQFVQKDPGAYAHNPKYVIEILYDSLQNLDDHAQVTVPNMGAMFRNDSGHFDGGAEAFRHWDQAQDDINGGEINLGSVSSSCVRCHSPEGFDFYAEYGIDLPISGDVGDGFRCEQCHVEDADFAGTPAVKYIDEVEFPGGTVISNDPGNPDDSFLCMSCHSGRESGITVEADIQARLNDGNPATNPRFRNVHYLAAGGTIYGQDSHLGYEYAGLTYVGKWNHFAAGGPSAQCTYCHLEDHTFEPQATALCAGCHGAIPLEEYRINRASDYDNDGDATEPLKDELESMAATLWLTMEGYAVTQLGGTLTMLPGYPYYSASVWDAALARAIYNYNFWAKEPGAWAHNTDYMAQLLYDSVDDLNGGVTGDAPFNVPGR